MNVCGICKEKKPFFCASCATYLSLNERLSLVNSSGKAGQLATAVNDLVAGLLVYEGRSAQKKPTASSYSRPLRNNATQLENSLTRLKNQAMSVQDANHDIGEQISRLKQENRLKRERIAGLRADLSKAFSDDSGKIWQRCSNRWDAIVGYDEAIAELQTSHCKELIHLFGIRKRRKKPEDNKIPPEDHRPEYNIIIGFSVLPTLTGIARYNEISLNTAMERLAYFCSLASHYLQIKLPYEILLPQRSHPYVRMGNLSKLAKRSLHLTSSVKTLAQSQPKQFEEYVEGLAMLVYSLLTIALHLNVEIPSVEAAVQLDRVLSKIYKALIPDSSGAATRAKLPPLQSFSQVSQLAQKSAPVCPIGVDAIQDYIVTQEYLELNGESGEWIAIGSLEHSASISPQP
ncbi:hypothetical protein TRVA0_020S01530 [Trichomonascus vanleenenianus]|uniref:uncharacterized protein n=1 Tax=Trichomonascus vanleenenianus TaxID=2268995 RepID=UPI003ECA4C1F